MSETVYDRTRQFWNQAPCGTDHMKELYQMEDKRLYFERFDRYFFEKYPYLISFLDIPQMMGKTVLEIGLGSGSTLGLECKFAKKVYGLDLSDETIELQRKRKEYYDLDNLELIRASATQIPLKSNSVDMVVSIGCIHHIPGAQKTVDEIYRVLKRGGVFRGMVYYRYSYKAIVGIPRYQKEDPDKRKTRRQTINEAYDGAGNPYARLYGRRDLKRLLHKFGGIRYEVRNMSKYDLWEGRFPDRYLDQFTQEALHRTWGRIMGSDLYFKALK